MTRSARFRPRTALAALAAAAVAAVAAVAVLVDRSGVEPGPTTPPAPPEAGARSFVPEWAVATDGTDVFLLRDGRRDALLVDRVDGAEAPFVAVAARPGTTPPDGTAAGGRDTTPPDGTAAGRRDTTPRDGTAAGRRGWTPQDVTVVVLEEGEGMFALRWFRWTGGPPVDAPAFPAPYQVQDVRTDGVVPQPVWAPDGGHLAWLEGGRGGPFSLRAIQWSDGPGSADDRNDDAGWGVEVALSPGARLQEWTWLVDDGTTARGQWVITDPLSGGEAGGASLVAYPLERQGDGALALPDAAAPYLQPDRGPAYLDVANGHAVLGEEDVRYFLRGPVAGPGEGTGDLAITAVQASDEGETLPLPEELGAAALQYPDRLPGRTRDPSSSWMSAGGDAVLVGSGGRAWIVARDGRLFELEPTIAHADFLLERRTP